MSQEGTPGLTGQTSPQEDNIVKIETGKLGQLSDLILPEAYLLPAEDKREKRYAVAYDATKMLQKLKEQRANRKKEDKNTPLGKDLCELLGVIATISFRLYLDKKEKKTFKKLLLEAEPDYLDTDDNTTLEIFTDDNDKLANDLFEFFAGKAVFIYGRHIREEELKPNLTPKLLEKFHKNLSVVFGQGIIDQEVESKDGSMDILYSVYQGLQHQIRFVSTRLGVPEGKDFPFLDLDNKKFEKRLTLAGASDIEGYLNCHADLATLLELTVFLKERGHAVALRLQNGFAKYGDFPKKLHRSYAI